MDDHVGVARRRQQERLALLKFHNVDPDTSAEAAVTNTTAAAHKALLVALFSAGGDFTDEEAGEATGLETVEARRRCSDLRDEGILMFTGTKRAGIRYPNKNQSVSKLSAS